MRAIPEPKPARPAWNVPTWQQYELYAYGGKKPSHNNAAWYALPDDAWTCPACRRTKFEIFRWCEKPGHFGDWVFGVCEHHDHLQDFGYAPRFQNVLICDLCNSADGNVKHVLGLPAAFSFSPEEIRGFIEPVPHGWHGVNYRAARVEYVSAVLADDRLYDALSKLG
jgi:hypothetical protein